MKLILPKTMDPRFSALAEKGTEEGFSVVEYTDSLPREKGIVFFPFAADEKTLCDALARLPAESLVFVGKATESVKKKAKAKGMVLTSLLEDPTYLLQNAVHTAEGTLAEVIFHTKRRLDELCILVYGYGNCGSAIARLLWLSGAEVWVWSRQRGQALAQRDGFNLFPAPAKGFGMFDAVINTVPDPVFSPALLSTMQKDSFFFQVASGFSGIAPARLEEIGAHFAPLHGLPGKYCPDSEADAIWNVVKAVLEKSSSRSTL